MLNNGLSKKTSQKSAVVVEDLSREMYSLDSNSIQANVPFGAKFQLQSFLHTAGFNKLQLSYQDKWLSQISINSSLNAFSLGQAKFNKKIDELSNKELIFMFNIALEKRIDNPNNTQLFNQLLQKIMTLEDSYSSLRKLFLISEHGYIDVESTTVETMFKFHPKLLDTCCEVLNKKSEKDLHISWMIKVCSGSPQLYGKLCENFMKKYPAFLPKFVESVCRCDNILPYPSHEQACALLCMMTPIMMASPLRNSHYSILINELLQLWLAHHTSVVKMINHFPCIIECLAESCDSNVSAKRLCVHLISTSSSQ